MSIKDALDPGNMPRHIAVIMDGNGRWAKRQGEQRIFGHQNAVQAVRNAAEGCAELGVEYLTLYTFSTENWGRPAEEVQALMQLLVHTIRAEIETLQKNDIRLAAIGHLKGLPESCQRELEEAMQMTSHHQRMTLTLALNYSGRWEITEAARALAQKAVDGQIDPAAIDEAAIEAYLQTAGMPDPELMIRTSGEMRISNYLLWQLAYTEIVVTPTLWPDFEKEDLWKAIQEYQRRERRFGKVLA